MNSYRFYIQGHDEFHLDLEGLASVMNSVVESNKMLDYKVATLTGYSPLTDDEIGYLIEFGNPDPEIYDEDRILFDSPTGYVTFDQLVNRYCQGAR